MSAKTIAGAKGHRGEILRGAATAFVFRNIGVALEFSFHVLVSRLLGADGAGVFFLALTVATMSSVFGRFGLDNAVLRYVAASREIDDKAAIRGVAKHGLSMAFGVTAAIVAALLASATLWAPLLTEQPGSITVVALVLLAAPAMSGMFIFGEMLKGLRRVGWSQFVVAVVPYAVAVTLLYFLVARYGTSGAAVAYVIGIHMALLVGLWLWRRAAPFVREVRSEFSRKRLIDTAIPLLAVKVLRLAAGWIATIAIAVLMSDADVGVFNAAMRTSLLLSLFLISVNSIVAPKFAALYERGDMEGLAHVARWSTLLLAVITLPVFLLFLGFPAWVLSWFGQDFVLPGTDVLLILTIGQIANVITGPVNYLLMMTGHEQDLRRITIISFAICAVAIWPCIHYWGLVGAAVAVASSMSAMNLLSAVVVRARLGFYTVPLLPHRQRSER